MKKLLVLASMMLIGAGTTFAQKGQHAIGGNIAYGSEIESLGIGVKYQYNITDQFRLEPSTTYFFGSNNWSMLDVNCNLHYLFPIAPSVTLYPLGGLTFTNWSVDLDGGSLNKDKFGVNLGGGAEFALNRDWALNMELKYQILGDSFDQAVFNVGVVYKF